MTGLIPFNTRYSVFPAERFCDIFSGLEELFTDGRSLRMQCGDAFRMDVEETDEAFKVYAELPGVKKDEIGLELNGDVLTISVKKEERAEEDKKNYLCRERRSLSMSRSVRLAEARVGGVKARLEDGVLSVTAEKEQKADKSAAIEIE